MGDKWALSFYSGGEGACGENRRTLMASGSAVEYQTCYVLEGLLGTDWLVDTWASSSSWQWTPLTGCGRVETSVLQEDFAFLIVVACVIGIVTVVAIVAAICVCVVRRRRRASYVSLNH